MKKIILSLVFVFAMVSTTFANSNEEQKINKVDEVVVKASLNKILNVDCIQLAFDVDAQVGGISYETFKAIVDNCEEQQQ